MRRFLSLKITLHLLGNVNPRSMLAGENENASADNQKPSAASPPKQGHREEPC